jgi:YidC/Oxa1 family membrane protein insertase
MTPLQIMQQRTTKGMALIQPELEKLQKKYKDKKDPKSQAEYSAAMQALYKEHKVNPLSGCLTLIIQLPLIMALFGVLREASTYITKLKDVYINLAQNLMGSVSNYKEVLQPYLDIHSMNGKIKYDLAQTTAENGVLGVKELLSKLTTSQWGELLSKIPTDVQTNIQSLIEQKNNYEWFGVNLVDTPAQLVKSGMWFAIIVPVLVWVSTIIYSKYTMAQTQAKQANSGQAANAQSEQTMKMMNTIFPVMTAFFSYTMPCGLALYWIFGNVIMMAQQIIVTKILEREDAARNLQ